MYKMTSASATYVSVVTDIPSFEVGCIASSGNNIYVSINNYNTGSGAIALYDTTGVLLNADFITTSDANFGGVCSMAFSNNYLYAVILGKQPTTPPKISVYNATTGELIHDSLVSGLNSYKFIAVSDNGNIYLSDPVNGISVYNATSGVEINDNFISGLNLPGAIAIGGDYLYVANYGGGTVGKYIATTGATINANFISGLIGPNAIVISDDGNYLYVANTTSTTVGMYNINDGSAVNDSLVEGLGGPEGIAIIGSILYIYSYFSEENKWPIGIFDVNDDLSLEPESDVGVDHASEYKLSWVGTDKTTGATVTGTYTYTISSTGYSYEDAHHASSEKSHDAIRDYLKKTVTPFYTKVHYIIENTSAN